jgi:hypothetical protein
MGFDNFQVDKDDEGQAVAVGGSWSHESGTTADIRFLPTWAAAMEVSARFEAQMRQIKETAGISPEEMERLKRSIIDMGVDQEALNTYRYLRVQAGHTDHKALLKKERQLRAWQKMARAWRIAGVELGWLFGFGVRWDFKYVKPEWRPFDWDIDCRW